MDSEKFICRRISVRNLEEIDPDWQQLTLEEAKKHETEILKFLNAFEIREIDGGIVYGRGYRGIGVTKNRARNRNHNKTVNNILITRRKNFEWTITHTEKLNQMHGWRKMNLNEARIHHNSIVPLIGVWDICLLDGGIIEGRGYHGIITEGKFRNGIGNVIICKENSGLPLHTPNQLVHYQKNYSRNSMMNNWQRL